MADIRSLLQQERKSRRITHPHASYTSDGKLLCNLCEIRVKTESAWQAHLHSSQHVLRSNRSSEAAGARGTADVHRKRKASAIDGSPETDRKRPRAPSPDTEADGAVKSSEDEATAARASASGPHAPKEAGLPTRLNTKNNHDTASIQQHPDTSDDLADPQQLEALERDLADLEASMKPQANLTAAPAISAAPMSVEQLAAQAREEQNAQRGRRDAEVEAEREDAARLLEDEFEEMENLEARIQKLRDRREALKIQARHDDNSVSGDTEGHAAGTTLSSVDADHDKSPSTSDDAESEDEEGEDELWRFGS